MDDGARAQQGSRRILLITRNLPPLRGGMERLNRHLALELARDAAVSIVGPTGCGATLPGLDVSEVAPKPLWRFFLGALRYAVVTARRDRPDVVIAGSGLMAPFAWCAARCAKARFVVYVHGLDLIADHWMYRWFWLPFLRRADQCIANSHNTARLANSIGIPAARTTIVHPGVDIPEVQTRNDRFRDQFKLGNAPLLLSVGRLIARKGLLEFVERALPRIVRAFPETCLIVVGDEAPDLLKSEDAGLGKRIRTRAEELEVSRNLRFIGPQDDATLAEAYLAADVHVFPVRDVPGDVEGFGMVAIEAAAHGLPTIGFAVGGVPDAVEEGVSGYLVPPDDYEQLADRIIERLRHRDDEALRLAARAFSLRFTWEIFGSRMRECLTTGHTSAE